MGMQGNLKLLTTGTGSVPLLTENREPVQGNSPGAPTRPPNDRIVIKNTFTRVPYLGNGLRIDGFAGTKYREDIQRQLFDYRAAPGLWRKVDMTNFRDSITRMQNRGAAVLAAAVAMPFAGGYIAAYPAAAAIGGTIGGTLNVAFDGIAAAWTHTPYTMEQAATNFARGALAGMAGGVVGALEIGIFRELALDYAVGFTMDTLMDVGWSGRTWSQSMSDNIVASAQGAGLGFAAGRIGAGLRSAGSHISAARSRGSAVMCSDGDLSKKFDVSGLTSRWFNPSGSVHIKNAEVKMFERMVRHELENGTPMSKQLAKMIVDGDMGIRFSRFTGEYADCMGLFRPGTKVLEINTLYCKNADTGKFQSRQVASTIVHEGIHFLGGGELSAHIGQAQFLDTRVRQSRRTGHLDYVESHNVPYLDAWHRGLLNFYRNDVVNLVMLMTKANYGENAKYKIYLPDSVTPNKWVIDEGGFAKILNQQGGILEVLEAKAKAGNRGRP